MALDSLKQNIEQEKKIVKEMLALEQTGRKLDSAGVLNSLRELLGMINDTIPSLVENISPINRLKSGEKEVKNLVQVKYETEGKTNFFTIKEDDKKTFLRELNLSGIGLKKIKEKKKEVELVQEFKKPSEYARLSNKIFSGISNEMVRKGNFKDLNSNLRKANLPFILNTYVSMMFFSALAAAVMAILIFVVLLIMGASLKVVLFVLLLPALVFFGMYYYPTSEKDNNRKKIEQELPFATMHMSAIAGSGIEPSQIFKIIALGREYPYVKQEIKKVINQVNVYGYDLVNALKNSARITGSAKMAELFNGLATTISSGGSLPDFLDKRTETLLFDYKLEREKSTKMAETFMDIYISVVIAAPMIMMLLMILISVSQISIGLSLQALTAIILAVVAIINLIFLVVLHIKQPVY